MSDSVKMVEHVPLYHCKDQGGVVSNQDEEDGSSEKEIHEKEKEDEDNPKFVFKECMLYEFIDQKK